MTAISEPDLHAAAADLHPEATEAVAATNGHPPVATTVAPSPLAVPVQLTEAVSLPKDFEFNQVLASPRLTGAPAPSPSLGPLGAFTGNWAGKGFNTIFRPDSSQTPTSLPSPAGGDNILELNLTTESLSFSAPLGSVPNRGMVQADAFLNGVPYLQAINDVTTGQSVGIHLEPGLWMIVPSTQDPSEGQTLVRMASIPHGTTIMAQGTWRTTPGAPTIPAAPITPAGASGPGHVASPGNIRFPSQTATAQGTARIPQDLSSFIANGTITQAMIDDPNTVLRNALSGQTITETTTISISTVPGAPLFGGGTDNIAFLLGNSGALGNPAGSGQNAQAIQMTATFWIEAVEHRLIIPPIHPGQPITLSPEPKVPGQPVPKFEVRPPVAITEALPLTVTSTQIQYSQTVILNFNGLSWPHVSVATLVPAGNVSVPPSAWE